MKQDSEDEQRDKLMQFLMDLNDDYETIRGKILSLEPLPTLNKAFDMIQRVERQRQITGCLNVSKEFAACTNKSVASTEVDISSQAFLAKNSSHSKKDSKNSKPRRFRDYCQRSDHTQDQCFQNLAILSGIKVHETARSRTMVQGSMPI